MLIKLDLGNVFDKLEWSFIKHMLEAIAIPDKLIKLILSCVSNSSSSIIINGTLSKELYNRRGIRQGDRFSPYLFILYLEHFSIQI